MFASSFSHDFQVHIGNADVAGKRVQIGAERPDVNVMHFLHALDAQHRSRHILQTNIAREPFQKNVPAFSQYARAGPKNHRADQDSDHGVNPWSVLPANQQRANKHRDVRKRVAKIVKPDRAYVEVLPAPVDRQRDAAVNHQRDRPIPTASGRYALQRGCGIALPIRRSRKPQRSSAAWRSQTPPGCPARW